MHDRSRRAPALELDAQVKVLLWLQKPPRVQWCLKLVASCEESTITIRMWFDDYPPEIPPPPSGVGPYAEEMARIANVLRGSSEDRHYSIQIGRR